MLNLIIKLVRLSVQIKRLNFEISLVLYLLIK